MAHTSSNMPDPGQHDYASRIAAGPASGRPSGASPIRLIDVLVLAAAHFGLVFALGAADIDFGLGYGVIGGLALQAALQVALLWLVLRVWRGLGLAEIGFVRLPPGWFFKSTLIGIGMILLVAPINLIVHSVLGGPQENPQITAIEPTGETPVMMLMTIALTAVVVPIIEEALFRGVLFRWLRGLAPKGVSIALSSGLFALAHGIPHLIPALAVLGAILAWSYERTGSLWAPIVIHGVFNGIMMVMVYGVLMAAP